MRIQIPDNMQPSSVHYLLRTLRLAGMRVVFKPAAKTDSRVVHYMKVAKL